ncbi:MAG: ribosomal small subunit protein bTHX [Candidatus Delongbacteria bacterium GWF2_40_14]|nr:MAG: ribosomal small subunit protein bTHX [Candidatus Delongbacteria bacterium GWF2_40_14]
MGRGDKKTRKGKIFRASSGNTRLKTKHPTNPLSQPDPNRVKAEKSDSIKKLADAKAVATAEKKAATDKKPVDKKPSVEKKAAPAEKKPAKAKKEE